MNKVVAYCPGCGRKYIWVPADGGTCLTCRIKLKPQADPPKDAAKERES